MAEKSKKTLGLKLSKERNKRKRDSDQDKEEDRFRSRARTEDVTKQTRHRSLSLGEQSKSSRLRSNSVGNPKEQPTSSHTSISNEEFFTTTDSGIGTTRGLLFPGHNYLGPGNPLDNGPPTNKVDEVAQHHDRAYQQASTSFESTGNKEEAFQLVQQADETFLNDLSDIEPASYTEFFGKLAGQVGIGLKKTTEGLLHSTLYPKFNTNMDVVDGNDENSDVLHIAPSQPVTWVINMGQGIRPSYITNWNFNKSFKIGL